MLTCAVHIQMMPNGKAIGYASDEYLDAELECPGRNGQY